MKKGSLHRFKFNGRNLVLDVESDTLHRVDDLAWDALDLMDQGWSAGDVEAELLRRYPPGQVLDVLREIELLLQEGMLWSPPRDIPPSRGKSIKALCMNVSHSCNLSCRYCFAGKGSYGGEISQMTRDVGYAAVDLLLSMSKGRRHLEIDYFGGEPLLNLEVVKDITAYARRKGRESKVEFGFTLTTNGLLLDPEVISFLRDEGFSLVMSLDGRREVHDRMRINRHGGGSYDRVSQKLLYFVRHWPSENYYVRGTYTRYNLDFCKDVFHLASLGFRHLSLEPAVVFPEDDWALRESDIPFLEAEYEKLALYYLDRYRAGEPFTFFHFEVDLESGPCLLKRLSGCGAGDEYLAVTPGGDLYPCHQLIGVEFLHMGTVFTPSQVRPLKGEVFPPSGPLQERCRSCWARYHCGGGCRAASFLVNGSFDEPYSLECALQKKRLECSLYIQSTIREIRNGSDNLQLEGEG